MIISGLISSSKHFNGCIKGEILSDRIKIKRGEKFSSANLLLLFVILRGTTWTSSSSIIIKGEEKSDVGKEMVADEITHYFFESSSLPHHYVMLGE